MLINKKKLFELALRSLKTAANAAKVKLSTKTEKIVQLGDGSAIDSIAFVNFIVELEELISKETKKNIPIKIDKIHSINTGKKKLTLPDFINALFKIINAKEQTDPFNNWNLQWIRKRFIKIFFKKKLYSSWVQQN